MITINVLAILYINYFYYVLIITIITFCNVLILVLYDLYHQYQLFVRVTQARTSPSISEVSCNIWSSGHWTRAVGS